MESYLADYTLSQTEFVRPLLKKKNENNDSDVEGDDFELF